MGTVITSDLKWEENTSLLVKKANARMQLLRKVATFTKDEGELKIIYILFIQSILEQSSVVWQSSLKQEDSNNLERIQKSALKVILNDDFEEYKQGLEKLNLQTLYQRRITLCENFALQTAKHNKLYTMFPRSEEEFNLKIPHAGDKASLDRCG